ncbi:MAG: hypothetical protein HC923_00755 [Myxococcales bacterium]|nr:hypothetical protein [Myxococcales bacterium]
MQKTLLISMTLSFSMLQTGRLEAAPPFAGDPNADRLPPKPESRAWNHKTSGLVVSFLFEPGVPDPNQVTTLTIVPSEPVGGTGLVGRTRPLEGADIVVTVKDPSGKKLGRYRAHPNPLSKAKYGLHYTPAVRGVHTVEVEGKLPNGKTFLAEAALPVDVWPLPAELEGTGDKVQGAGIKRPLSGPVSK